MILEKKWAGGEGKGQKLNVSIAAWVYQQSFITSITTTRRESRDELSIRKGLFLV